MSICDEEKGFVIFGKYVTVSKCKAWLKMLNRYKYSSLFSEALATKKNHFVIIASSWYCRKYFNYELM
jgi:hypothetical protein